MNRMMPTDEPTMPMPTEMDADPPERRGEGIACRDGTCVHNDDAGGCTLPPVLVELDEQHICVSYERAEGTEEPEEEMAPPPARPAPRVPPPPRPSVPAPPRRR